MKLEFGEYAIDYGSELKCPKCGSYYLHHRKVEIFDRGEDEEKGLHITAGKGTMEANTDMSGNPSRRRDGLKIYFRCEECQADPILSIWQHKGSTVFNITYRTS